VQLATIFGAGRWQVEGIAASSEIRSRCSSGSYRFEDVMEDVMEGGSGIRSTPLETSVLLYCWCGDAMDGTAEVE